MKHHKHLIVRAKISNPPSNEQQLKDWCSDVVSSVGMNVLEGPHCCYSDIPDNEGYTCMAILDFSHIVIHFWDKKEIPFFEFDLFSCKDFDVNIPIDKLKQFGIVAIAIQYINRDLFDSSNKLNTSSKILNEESNLNVRGERLKSDKLSVVYKTTNNINGDYYIGKHTFDKLNDGYLGSGKIIKEAIKKYGRNNFTCKHLKYFSTETEAYDFETTLLTDENNQ